MRDLVDRYSEVVINVRRFNQDIKNRENIITQLSQFRHWYYVNEINQVGPSKYIGYKNMSSSRYNRGRGKDGRDTEARLIEWFQKLGTRHSQWNKIYAQLENILMIYGKTPNKRIFMHVRK
jgi:hypothetical protein